jgi:hypothetical protein
MNIVRSWIFLFTIDRKYAIDNRSILNIDEIAW